MQSITFITGNQEKADYLAKYLGFPIEHIKLDLDELQSLDLREIVEHKVKQAYAKIWKPVLVDDVSLEFVVLGRLPGTFIRFFLEEMTDYQNICDLLRWKDRSAIARCGYGYYDGDRFEYFEGSMKGTISESPSGDGGFGWDRFFVPEWYTITRAEMDEADDAKTYMQIKPFAKVREFLVSR
jgi:non-canonical purine NTP pyrophosphatase (RdgB/HAM1 family)